MVELSSKVVARGFSHVLNRVAYGREKIVVTRCGRPLAMLLPLDDERAQRTPATSHSGKPGEQS